MTTQIYARFATGFVLITLIAVAISASVNVHSGAKAISAASSPQRLDQKQISGEWKAGPSRGEWNKNEPNENNINNISDPGRINLQLERQDKAGHNQIGHNYDLSELQGLTREQISGGGQVKFSLVREAGTIDCEGSFQNGRGSGEFRFTPNPAFIGAMKARGFDFESDTRGTQDSEERVFSAAALNVTTALADDLSSAGFGKLGVEDLFKAAIFKVDSKFMREMKASGFPNLGMEELVKARIFKIDAEFVRQVAQMGFDKEPFESLVKMQIFKVSPEFISEVRNEGLTDISVEELVKLRIFKIDGQYIRQARSEGVPVEVERLVQRKIGVGRQ